MSALSVAIVGCGGMAGAHAQVLHGHQDTQIVALCDLNEQIITGFIEHNLKDCDPRPRVFTETAQLYEEATPDAVFVVSPHTLHFDHCMEALEHGCHVFVEKPMVTSANHAHQLKTKVDQAGKILVIGYNTPCTPEFDFLREQIRHKTYGTLELVSGYVVQNWMHYTRDSWRQDPALSGGGQAYDTGAHLLNSLCWTVESNVDEVFAFIDNQDTPVDVNSAITIRFANGVYAAITIGGNCASDGGYLMYAFANGRVTIDGWAGSWIDVHDQHGRVKYPPIDGQAQSPVNNFIDAILGRADPRTTPINGVVQSELMDAIYESARTGKPARPQRD